MPLDPALQQLLNQMPAVPSGPIDYPDLRKQAAAFLPLVAPPESLLPVDGMEEVEVEYQHGRVPLRIYRPVGKPIGILHYIHGGGWSVGDLAMVDHTARRLCDGLSMVIVTSTYRLAPENPFPAGFDDSLAAARWVQAHRSDLGGGSLPTVIGGDSAGGNLAAAVVLEMREAEEPMFDIQLLLYPALDLRPSAVNYESRLRNADPTLRTDMLKVYLADYVGEANTSDRRISPLAADDLSNLPPALIVVQSVDPLHDEAKAYADRLRGAGVTVELLEFDNLTHGFVHLSALIPAAAKAVDAVMACLRSMIAAHQ